MNGILVGAIWLLVQPIILQQFLISSLPPEFQSLSSARTSLLMADIKNLANGAFIIGDADPVVQDASERLERYRSIGNAAMFALVLGVAVGGMAWGRFCIVPTLRSRQAIERVLSVALFISSTVAIITTIGIILSLLFEALRFFNAVAFTDFLFGLVTVSRQPLQLVFL